MEVCFGNPADIDRWMHLVDEVRENFPGLETEKDRDMHRLTVLKFMEKRQALCAKSDDRIQGVLLFSRKRNRICCLAVSPESRRHGIASGLLETALGELDRCRDITVSTFREDDEKGTAARALYRKFGFVGAELTEEFGYPNQVFVLRGTPGKIEFRKAGLSDAELLIEIYNSAFSDDYIRYGTCPAYGKTKEMMERSIVNYPKFLILYNGRPVGSVSCRETESGMYEIGCLCVIPEYQGKGIGTAAMEFIKGHYQNWKRITLVTPADKTENVRFYTEKGGFGIQSFEMDGCVKVARFILERTGRQAVDTRISASKEQEERLAD
ncbi:MAG: GNAT family N-acetyltransferase [Clostridia bacterium]|nr:GNAT family N-acetyltransferase [Clostridia bacterium]